MTTRVPYRAARVVDMDFDEVLRRRRMVRDFDPAPLALATVERVAAAALRAPSAGFTQAVDVVVLTGPAVELYWDVNLAKGRRANFPWPGLLAAPALLVLTTSEQAYRDRYAEADKSPRPGASAEREWPVPWWYFDAGAAASMVLLAATAEGLGALLFAVAASGPLSAALGLPADRQPAATIAVGRPGPGDRRSGSLARGRRPASQAIHWGRWQTRSGS